MRRSRPHVSRRFAIVFMSGSARTQVKSHRRHAKSPTSSVSSPRLSGPPRTKEVVKWTEESKDPWMFESRGPVSRVSLMALAAMYGGGAEGDWLGCALDSAGTARPANRAARRVGSDQPPHDRSTAVGDDDGGQPVAGGKARAADAALSGRNAQAVRRVSRRAPAGRGATTWARTRASKHSPMCRGVSSSSSGQQWRGLEPPSTGHIGAPHERARRQVPSATPPRHEAVPHCCSTWHQDRSKCGHRRSRG